MGKKPAVLLIMDGFGLNENHEHNAVYAAKTPVIDKLMKEYPFVKGYASGLAVGLPDGQMGNSEVGHMNMGAGRIIYQELTRISKEIEDGDFFKNEAWICRRLPRQLALQLLSRLPARRDPGPRPRHGSDPCVRHADRPVRGNNRGLVPGTRYDRLPQHGGAR